MDDTHLFLDGWLKAQQQMAQQFLETASRLQRAASGLGTGGASDASGLQSLAASWSSTLMKAISETGTANLAVVRETWGKATRSSNIYWRLRELWLPLIQAIQEKAITEGPGRPGIDPAKYKTLLDAIFGFQPEAVAEFHRQLSRLLEVFTGAAQGQMKPWGEALQQSLAVMPQLAEGHPESFLKVFHALYSASDRSLGWVFHVPAVGKDREKIELLLRCLDDLSVLHAKNIEYHHLMYVTGFEAFEQVVATLAEKVRGGHEISRFDDFFDLWIDVNEKTFFARFQTEKFGKLQGELLEAGLQVRKRYFSLAELYLNDLPIALRSEMDDLYKTVQDLKRRVRTLENKLREVNA